MAVAVESRPSGFISKHSKRTDNDDDEPKVAACLFVTNAFWETPISQKTKPRTSWTNTESERCPPQSINNLVVSDLTMFPEWKFAHATIQEYCSRPAHALAYRCVRAVNDPQRLSCLSLEVSVALRLTIDGIRG